MSDAIKASETEIVTVALRRVDFSENKTDDLSENFLNYIDTEKIQLLPNTSGASDAEEAVRLAKLARAMGCGNWVKLEIHPNPRHLMPDPVETLKAATDLIKDGFVVLPYINADPVLAKRLEEAGCATVMPLGSPIGSNKGIKTRDNIEIIIEEAEIPVVIDAGLGCPSHAADAMEMGADAVLVNTAIAISSDPVKMAESFKWAVRAGRQAFQIMNENINLKNRASASSPLTGFLSTEKEG
jgi:thiazole synthase